MAQWVEKKDEGGRVLEILEGAHRGADTPSRASSPQATRSTVEFQVPAVHPLGLGKVTSYVTVLADPGLAEKTGTMRGLTEIPYSCCEPAGKSIA